MGSELPTGLEKAVMVRAMFDRIAKRYDLVNGLISFGLDRFWREKTVRSLLLVPGSLVLDLACGTGDLTVAAKDYGHRSAGIDLSFGMLAAAKRKDTPLAQADAGQLPIGDASADGILSGFALRNFSELELVFGEMARVLRPGGRIALLEVDRPRWALMSFGHRLWMQQVVPRIGALLSDPGAYRYLPRSLAYLPDHDALADALCSAGFASVTRRPLAGGAAQIITATRSGQSLLANSSKEKPQEN